MAGGSHCYFVGISSEVAFFQKSKVKVSTYVQA